MTLDEPADEMPTAPPQWAGGPSSLLGGKREIIIQNGHRTQKWLTQPNFNTF